MALNTATTTPAATPRQRSLGMRLVLVTLAFSLLYTLVAVAVLGASALDAEQSTMNDELEQVEQIYSDTLTKAIWELDREALQNHLETALHVPAVGRIEVQITLAHGAPQILTLERPGWQSDEDTPTRRSQLVYAPYPGAKEVVGSLLLQGDGRLLQQRLRARLAVLIVTQTLQSLLLAGLIMWVFHRMVTVHVRRIAQHLAALTPSTLHTPLAPLRPAPRGDELDQLADGVNQLQQGLASHLDQQQRYEKELASHRDDLAHMVEQRTAELQLANARLQNLARTDALTHLPNRRHFDEAKNVEFQRALRTGTPVSLLVCDIDNFKAYNDHYGHAMGDQCLAQVAEVLRDTLARAGDLVARIGGEEFGILLPATDGAAAFLLAERVRAAVQAAAIPHAHSPAAPVVTISIGLAVLELGKTRDFDDLFDEADQALYRAKAAGRNQVAGPLRLEPMYSPGGLR